MDGNMWTFILCLTSMAMYQAAGKNGKKVQTCLSSQQGETNIADSTYLNFSIFFLTFGYCWWPVQSNYFSNNLHENWVQFPEERNAFVLNPNTTPA